jgi:hypothetical protein
VARKHVECEQAFVFGIHSARLRRFVAEARGFLIIMKKVPQVFRNPGGSPALRNYETKVLALAQ